jgi:hypothetical protein
MKCLYIALFSLILHLPLFGQINLKAGYCMSWLKADEYNAILHAHNASMTGIYSDPFKALEILHGMDIGLEYRWETFALEAGWRTKRNRLEATGVRSEIDFRNSLKTSINSFFGGLVQYYGHVRLSASVDYNVTVSKVEFDDPAIFTTFKDSGWGSSFSLGYVFRGSGPISLVIAPYAQLQWGDYDLTEFRDAITESVVQYPAEDFFNFGITLYFLNGPQ